MADVTAGAACHNKAVWKCPEDPRSGASRVDLLGEKINLFSTLKTEYRKQLINAGIEGPGRDRRYQHLVSQEHQEAAS